MSDHVKYGNNGVPVGVSTSKQGKAITPYTQTGAGAIPVSESLIYLVTDSADALTLADGEVEGQEIEIIMTVDAGDGTLTPASFLDGTTATFGDVGDVLKLKWVSTLDSGNGQWVVTLNKGVTIA